MRRAITCFAIVLASAAVAEPAVAVSLPFEDAFDDNATSADWAAFAIDGDVDEANQRVEVTLFKTPKKAPKLGSGAGYLLDDVLPPNIQISVDYAFVDWPKRNGARVELVMESEKGVFVLQRRDARSGRKRHAYRSFFVRPGHPKERRDLSTVKTKDTSGRLKIVKVGTTATASVNDEVIGTTDGLGSGPVLVSFGLHGRRRGVKGVTTAFDDFMAV